jgi:hypothetical protein
MGKNPDSVNAGSLRVTVKRTVHHLKRLKHARNDKAHKNIYTYIALKLQ